MKISLFHNFWLKIIALILAVLIWRIIYGEITTVRTFDNIPLQLLLPENMLLTSEAPPTMSLTLSGPREAIDQVNASDIIARHDLRKEEKPVQVSFRLTKQDLIIPRRTEIVAINPEKIEVEIDNIAEKNLPIKAVFEGKPAQGYIVKEFSLNQSVITVKGPQKDLERLKFIETKPINLKGHDRTFLQEVSLQSVVPGQDTQKKVQVLVKVEREFVKQTFSQIPIMILDNSDISRKSVISSKSATIELSGPKELLPVMDPEKIKIYVDISNLKPGKYTLPVSTLLPVDVHAERINPDEIEVEIKSPLEV